MKIMKSGHNLNFEFNNPHIKKLQYDDKGNLKVINQQDEEVSHFKTIAQVVFNGQYGTPISEDGNMYL